MYDFNTTVGQVLDNYEAARALDEVIPGASSSEKLQAARSFTLERIANTPGAGISEYEIQEFLRRINERTHS